MVNQDWGWVDTYYRRLIQHIMNHGTTVNTRNSETRRIMRTGVEFDSTPLVSLRKTAWKNALREWEWFMSGHTEIEKLHPAVHSWWKPFAKYYGPQDHHVPYNYSYQFRGFHGSHHNRVDQIEYIIDTLKNHPYSRRNVITTWNTADMVNENCPITNCHGTVIQFFVQPDQTLHMNMYQRSTDVICGLPHNWIQYWAFLMWLAHRTNLTPGSFEWIGGDTHIYKEHYQLAEKLINISQYPSTPQLLYNPTSEEFKADDFTLAGEYQPINNEKAEMIV